MGQHQYILGRSVQLKVSILSVILNEVYLSEFLHEIS